MNSNNDQRVAEARALRRVQRRQLVHQISLLVGLIIASTGSLVQSLYHREPYHTSSLSGENWVLELLVGHPERIRCELGVCQQVFGALISDLHEMGHGNSRHVSLEEQLAIFLYGCVTGLPVRHLGERFQRSNDTISRYVSTRINLIAQHLTNTFNTMIL
jgi:hypothetical protein